MTIIPAVDIDTISNTIQENLNRSFPDNLNFFRTEKWFLAHLLSVDTSSRR